MTQTNFILAASVLAQLQPHDNNALDDSVSTQHPKATVKPLTGSQRRQVQRELRRQRRRAQDKAQIHPSKQHEKRKQRQLQRQDIQVEAKPVKEPRYHEQKQAEQPQLAKQEEELSPPSATAATFAIGTLFANVENDIQASTFEAHGVDQLPAIQIRAFVNDKKATVAPQTVEYAAHSAPIEVWVDDESATSGVTNAQDLLEIDATRGTTNRTGELVPRSIAGTLFADILANVDASEASRFMPAAVNEDWAVTEVGMGQVARETATVQDVSNTVPAHQLVAQSAAVEVWLDDGSKALVGGTHHDKENATMGARAGIGEHQIESNEPSLDPSLMFQRNDSGQSCGVGKANGQQHGKVDPGRFTFEKPACSLRFIVPAVESTETLKLNTKENVSGSANRAHFEPRPSSTGSGRQPKSTKGTSSASHCQHGRTVLPVPPRKKFNRIHRNPVAPAIQPAASKQTQQHVQMHRPSDESKLKVVTKVLGRTAFPEIKVCEAAVGRSAQQICIGEHEVLAHLGKGSDSNGPVSVDSNPSPSKLHNVHGRHDSGNVEAANGVAHDFEIECGDVAQIKARDGPNALGGFISAVKSAIIKRVVVRSPKSAHDRKSAEGAAEDIGVGVIPEVDIIKLTFEGVRRLRCPGWSLQGASPTGQNSLAWAKLFDPVTGARRCRDPVAKLKRTASEKAHPSHLLNGLALWMRNRYDGVPLVTPLQIVAIGLRMRAELGQGRTWSPDQMLQALEDEVLGSVRPLDTGKYDRVERWEMVQRILTELRQLYAPNSGVDKPLAVAASALLCLVDKSSLDMNGGGLVGLDDLDDAEAAIYEFTTNFGLLVFRDILTAYDSPQLELDSAKKRSAAEKPSAVHHWTCWKQRACPGCL